MDLSSDCEMNEYLVFLIVHIQACKCFDLCRDVHSLHIVLILLFSLY